MGDSLYVAVNDLHSCCQSVSSICSEGWVDKTTAIAMAVIALFDVLLTILIFRKTRNDNKTVEQNHRRFELMHSLILEHNIDRLYEFYDRIYTECSRLLSSQEKNVKDEVNASIKNEAKYFRLRFLTLFTVIDASLYKDMLDITDRLIDGITESIYDDGLNLINEPKFDQEISQKISKSRTDMLAKLYSMSE